MKKAIDIGVKIACLPTAFIKDTDSWYSRDLWLFRTDKFEEDIKSK